MIRAGVFWIMCSATAAQAQVLEFPANASLQASETSPLGSYDLPVAIWADGQLPVTTVEGELTREAWRIGSDQLTTLQLLRPLREQLRDNRFRILFECQTEACGGFDFRFATSALPPPEMQINIGDFRFLTAERSTPEGPEYISLFISRTAQAGFVQVTRVAPVSATPVPLASPGAAVVAATDTDVQTSVASQLDNAGRAVLPDLTFATGSAMLTEQPFASLAELATYLSTYPDREIALVGHTDSTGGLDTNIALSKRRAGAVLERLVSEYGVNRRQLAAEGMGYLAPLASNLTEAGREANRRVEVIITSTQ